MGIPIHIICKGIKKTCRQFRSTHQEGDERIDILTYCEPEILRLWKEYRRALLGSPESDSRPDSSEGSEKREAEDKLHGVVLKRLSLIREDMGNFTVDNDPYKEIKSEALLKLEWSKELDLIEEENCKEGGLDIDLIEDRLNRLDNAYINNLFQLLPKELIDEIRKEAEEELASYKEQMEKESYIQTLELSTISLFRERLNLRRISLYST